MESRVWAFAPFATAGAVALCFMSLAGCDGAPSAVPARSHAQAGTDRRLADEVPAGAEARAPARADRASYASGERTGERAAPAPLFHGKPIWAANRNHTAQENADYHYKRDGEALGATSEDDFLAKVHAFVDNPPKGVQTLTRANGDRLMYDPKVNLFAVVDRDGAPRTLFKPRDGAAYWEQQKQTLADEGDDSRPRRRAARRLSADDNG